MTSPGTTPATLSTDQTGTPDLRSATSWKPWLLPALLMAALVWAYWPALTEMAHSWSVKSEYSHGYLVPAFAAAWLWVTRKNCPAVVPGFSVRSFALLVFSLVLRFVGDYLNFDWLTAISLLPCLAALAWILGGPAVARWASPAILFLAFMVPLPYSVERALTHPLQRVGTLASTYALQTLGLPALSEGNVILLHQYRLNVVEACSGLSMLVIFFALCTGAAVIMRRPLQESLIVVASAIPIALIANIARITATGILYVTLGRKWGDKVFHDFAGWLMMPFALGLLWIEGKVLARLFVEDGAGKPAGGKPSGKPVPNGVPSYKAKSRRQMKKGVIFPPLPHGRRKP